EHCAVPRDQQGPFLFPGVPAGFDAEVGGRTCKTQPFRVGIQGVVNATEHPYRPPLAPQPFFGAEHFAGVADARKEPALVIDRMPFPEWQDVAEEMCFQPFTERPTLTLA